MLRPADVAVPAGQRVTAVAARQGSGRLESLQLTTDAGAQLALGGKTSSAEPLAVFRAPQGAALGRFAAAFAYPGGPIYALKPAFSKPGSVPMAGAAGGDCVDCNTAADCAAAGGGSGGGGATCNTRTNTCA